MAGHREYQKEIEARKEPFDRFVQMGEALIGRGHFLAEEIQDKVTTLTQRRHQLLETWQRREEIYLRNMDALLFERDAAQLESWLESREKLLAHENLGSSISEVEELIRRHEDFTKTLDAQDQKAEALKRITLVNLHIVLYRSICSYVLIFYSLNKHSNISASWKRRLVRLKPNVVNKID